MYKKSIIFILLSIISYSIASNNTKCNLCKDLVNIIDNEIHLANSTINIIEEIVKEACNHMIIPFRKNECLFILDNLQDIIDWLLDGFTPSNICMKIGLC